LPPAPSAASACPGRKIPADPPALVATTRSGLFSRPHGSCASIAPRLHRGSSAARTPARNALPLPRPVRRRPRFFTVGAERCSGGAQSSVRRPSRPKTTRPFARVQFDPAPTFVECASATRWGAGDFFPGATADMLQGPRRSSRARFSWCAPPKPSAIARAEPFGCRAATSNAVCRLAALPTQRTGLALPLRQPKRAAPLRFQPAHSRSTRFERLGLRYLNDEPPAVSGHGAHQWMELARLDPPRGPVEDVRRWSKLEVVSGIRVGRGRVGTKLACSCRRTRFCPYRRPRIPKRCAWGAFAPSRPRGELRKFQRHAHPTQKARLSARLLVRPPRPSIEVCWSLSVRCRPPRSPWSAPAARFSAEPHMRAAVRLRHRRRASRIPAFPVAGFCRARSRLGGRTTKQVPASTASWSAAEAL